MLLNVNCLNVRNIRNFNSLGFGGGGRAAGSATLVQAQVLVTSDSSEGVLGTSFPSYSIFTAGGSPAPVAACKKLVEAAFTFITHEIAS